MALVRRAEASETSVDDKELYVLVALTSDLAIFALSFAALLATALAIFRDVRASRPLLGA